MFLFAALRRHIRPHRGPCALVLLAAGLQAHAQQLDPLFGQLGITTVQHSFSMVEELPSFIEFTADGRILVTGQFAIISPGSSDELFMARFSADGMLDAGFGTNGWARINVNGGDEQPHAMRIGPGDALYLLGEEGYNTLPTMPPYDHSILTRTTLDGVLDPGYGAGGHFLFSLGAEGNTRARGMAPVDGGSMNVLLTHDHETPFLRMIRVLPTGMVDPLFTTVTLGDPQAEGHTIYPERTIPLPNGGFLVHGAAQVGSEVDLFLAKLDGNGALDPTWAGDGWLVDTMWDVSQSARHESLLLDPQGRLLVNVRQDFLPYGIVRYSANGELDPTFGTEGRIAVPGTGITQFDIDAQGRIVVLKGQVVYLFDPDGQPIPTFGTQGAYTLPATAALGTSRALRVDPEGRVLITASVNAGQALRLVRVVYDLFTAVAPAAGAAPLQLFCDGPAGRVTLRRAATTAATALLFDATGRGVGRYAFSGPTVDLPLAAAAPGVYVVVVADGTTAQRATFLWP